MSLSDFSRLSMVSALLLAAFLTTSLVGCGQQGGGPTTAQNSGFEVGDDDDDPGPSTPLTPSPIDPANPVAPANPIDLGPPPAVNPAGGNGADQDFAIPANATPEKLLDLIAKINERQPQGQTQEAMIADVRRMQEKSIEVADKLLTMETPEETRTKAVEAKLGALRMLAQLGTPGVLERIKDYCKDLQKEKNEKLALLGRVIPFSIQVGDLAAGESEDVDGLMKELDTLLAMENREENVFAVTQQAALALQRLGKTEMAAQAFQKIGTAFKDSENADMASAAGTFLEQSKLIKVNFDEKQNAALMDEPDSMKPFMDTAQQLLTEGQPGELVFNNVERAARYMEITQHSDQASQLYRWVSAAYKEHPDKELAERAEGSVNNGLKRLALIGKPFDVAALKPDGSEFDWSKYKGKVVLIDFWATWCGPCLQEIPNIKRHYDDYKDKGFEVIGINLDEDAQALERFLTTQSLPWPTVISPDPDAVGFQNPMAVKCGVDAIPFIVLINAEGNVEAIHVRGAEVGKQLEKLLGPAEPAPDTPPAKPDDPNAPKPDAPKPDAPKPDAPKPDAPKPDAPKPDAPKPDAPKPDAPKPDAPKPDAPKPDAPKPDAPKPDAPKPDAPKPDAPKPDAPKPDAPKPDAPKPDAPEPDAPEPDAPEPDAPKPADNGLSHPVDGTYFVFWADDEDKKEDDSQVEDESNPYLAPEGLSPAELVDYLLDMEEKPLSIQRRPGFAEAICEAADRVLAADTSDKFQILAAEAKFNVLHERASFGSEVADKQLMEFVERMKDDSRQRIARHVKFFQLERRVIDSDDLPVEKLQELLTELKTFFAEEKLGQRHLRIASSTVHAINRLDDGDAREKFFVDFGNLFAKSRDKELARYGKKLAKKPGGKASDLVGKPLELDGDTADGAPFDWASYRGKVVLVDFWATWCGPCRRAMPQVKALHEKLNAQGFEVVGISLDQDLDALAEYLDENDIPWTNLMGEQTQPLAQRYGVRGIPTMMLIGRDGNVVAVSHNIGALTAQAEKLVGEKS